MDIQTIAIIASAALLFGLLSRRLQMSVITLPLAFALLGLGLSWLGVLELEIENSLIEILAEITLVIILFTDAARIDLPVFKREYGLATRLLGIGLPLTIVVGTGAAFILLTGIGLWQAALLGAILAPTDAALGQAVVTDKRVPVRIRQTLNVESGLNDGLALPLVLLFIALANMEAGNIASWLEFIGFQLVLAPIAGIFIGYLGGELIDRATKAGWINKSFSQLSALSLALLAFAVAELLGGNGFIAAFVAGLTLGNSKRDICHDLYEFAEAEGQLLTLFVFLIFGASMVGDALANLTWPILAYALISLTLVRMIPAALSLVGTRLQFDSVLFLGWFGPRGIASLIYGLLLLEHRIEQGEFMFQIVVTTVFLSTILHGVTAVPFASLYGKRAEAMKDEPDMPELEPISEMPLRY